MSFRARLTVLAALGVAVGIVLASVAVYIAAEKQLRGGADSDLRSRAVVLRTVYASLPSFRGRQRVGSLDLHQWAILTQQISRQTPGEPTIYVQVNAPRFTLDPRFGAPAFPKLPPTLVKREGEVWHTVTRHGTEFRILALPIAGGVVQIARPLADVEANLRHLRFVLLFVSLGGVALAFALGLLVSRTAVAPLRRLVRATDEVISTGELNARIGHHSHDELGRLSTRFDEMLQTLESSLRSQRQLVADASHELRTPLASLRANLELLVSQVQPVDGQTELVSAIRRELEEMTKTLTELLELARGEEPELHSEEFRLDRVVEAAVARVEARAEGVRFQCQLEPSVVYGVPERVERAVTNLLDNARKWSPSGAAVDVAIRNRIVEVRDRGPGVDPSDRPLIFDRFYRAPAARGTAGAGLGLAIVKQIAEAQGGQVTVENADDGGAVFRLALSERH